MVECDLAKVEVAGSNPVSRSMDRRYGTRLGIQAPCRVQAHVAQSAERVLGKDEVSGSIPDMGSIFTDR